MIDTRATPLFLGENPASVPLPREAARAYLALVAAIGAALTGGLLVLSVARASGGEAERIAGTDGAGYPAALVSALATNPSKPQR